MAKLGLGVLAFDSALGVHNSWGDAGSVAFVLLADAALLLLFLCLRQFDRAAAAQGGQGGGAGRRWNSEGGHQYSALAAVGVAAVMCQTALDARKTQRDMASAAFLSLSYINLVGMTGLFLRTVYVAHRCVRAPPKAGAGVGVKS